MNPSPSAKILLFKGGDPISWVVQMQTRSPYSHVGLLDTCGRCVIEAYPGTGVRRRILSLDDEARIDAYDVAGLTEQGYKQALAFAKSQLGKKYDWRGVLRFVDKLPARENDKWFCSELVHKSLSTAGVRLLERIPSAEVSPAMVAWSPLLVHVPDWTVKEDPHCWCPYEHCPAHTDA